MKLLHVIRRTDPEDGGPIEALLRLSEVHQRDGHTAEIACLEPQSVVDQRGLPLRAYGLGTESGGWYAPRLVPWLRENASRYDAVIVHGLWNYTSIGTWRALRKSGTPYYIFSHGMMDPWFRDAFPRKHMAKQIYWSLLQGRALRDARAVLFTCDEERIVSRGVFKGHSYNERVVLFGTSEPPGNVAVEKAAFAQAFPALKDKRFLLFLSRIHPKKGCDLLIRAFAEMLPQLPADMDVVIAGPDQVGWKAELDALAEQLGVRGRVHWPGMLKGDLKWGAYRTAEALILPSHQENFGIVVAEAMACSIPVLISNKVNIWREVDREHAGLVAPDTLEGTRDLMRGFFAMSEEQRRAMGVSGREAFAKYFHIEAAARDLLRAVSEGKNAR